MEGLGIMDRDVDEAYRSLGFSCRTMDKRRVRRHWRKLSIKHHPDKGGSSEKFQSIQLAFKTIKSHIKRYEIPIKESDDRKKIQRKIISKKEKERSLKFLNEKVVDHPMTMGEFDRILSQYNKSGYRIPRLFEKSEDFDVERFNHIYDNLLKKKKENAIICVDPEPFNETRQQFHYLHSEKCPETAKSAFAWTDDSVSSS